MLVLYSQCRSSSFKKNCLPFLNSSFHFDVLNNNLCFHGILRVTKGITHFLELSRKNFEAC